MSDAHKPRTFGVPRTMYDWVGPAPLGTKAHCGLKAILPRKRHPPMIGTVLIVLLIILLIGAVPSWPYSLNWGYGPSGILGLLLVIVLILALLGHI
jgi:peptidoglycan/LPS O-acetylase OafA/YrhL